MNANLNRVANRVENAAHIISHTGVIDLGDAGLALSWEEFNDIADGVEALAANIVAKRADAAVANWRRAVKNLRDSTETDVRAHSLEQATWDDVRAILFTLSRLGRKTEGRLADLTAERVRLQPEKPAPTSVYEISKAWLDREYRHESEGWRGYVAGLVEQALRPQAERDVIERHTAVTVNNDLTARKGGWQDESPFAVEGSAIAAENADGSLTIIATTARKGV